MSTPVVAMSTPVVATETTFAPRSRRAALPEGVRPCALPVPPRCDRDHAGNGGVRPVRDRHAHATGRQGAQPASAEPSAAARGVSVAIRLPLG
eukprot:1144710-Prorocentrum_minimum.AAC.1